MSSSLDRAVKDFVQVLQESKEKGTSPYDTTATVTRVEDSIAWVHIPGGVEETPVEMTMGVKAGDTVQVRVSGGKAWIAGNATSPPTDDTAANEAGHRALMAEEVAVIAGEKAENAEIAAKKALRIAADTDQYFWHMETGTDTGTHITEIPHDEFIARTAEDPTDGGPNLLARSGGIAVREGLQELAQFSDYIVLGKDDGSQSYLYADYHSLRLIDKEGDPYVYFSDLRNSEGVYDGTTEYKIKDNTDIGTLNFIFDVPVSEIVSITCNGVALSYEQRSEKRVSIDTSSLSIGDIIIIIFKSTDRLLKAFTFGRRTDGEVVGLHSFAFGDEVTASGTFSHAEGWNTTASGLSSHAEGNSTWASGNFAHAEGFTTTASGDRSHAEGRRTTASGDSSHAEGALTTARGENSHAEGSETTAGTSCTHAEGEKTSALNYRSHAEGLETTASGENSHAEGNKTTAKGTNSHAEGHSTTASGFTSHAEGCSTTASKNYTHAEGYSTTASMDYSHAEGYSTTASGWCSHAEGWKTTASENASHAQNYCTIAGYDSQTAIGKYNKNKSSSAFEIGNGTSDTARSNALEVTWNGMVSLTGNRNINGSSQEVIVPYFNLGSGLTPTQVAEGIVKKIVELYGKSAYVNTRFMGHAQASSNLYYDLFIYDPTDKQNGLPKYSFGSMYRYGGTEYRFGTQTYALYVNNVVANGVPNTVTSYDNTKFTYEAGFGAYATTGGNAPYADKFGRIVTLSGAFKATAAQTSTGQKTIGKVPAGCEPLRTLRVIEQGSDRARFLLTINPSGVLMAERYSSTGTDIAIPNGAWLNIFATYISKA